MQTDNNKKEKENVTNRDVTMKVQRNAARNQSNVPDKKRNYLKITKENYGIYATIYIGQLCVI